MSRHRKKKYVRGSASQAAFKQAAYDTDGDLRKKRSTIFQPLKPAAPFQQYVHSEIIPRLRLGNRILDRKYDTIVAILANLFLAHKAGGRVLADSRNSGDRDARSRIAIYDELVRTDMIRKRIGSEQSAKLTRYALSHLLAHTARQLEFKDIIDPLLDEPTSERQEPSEFAPVILRPRKNTQPGCCYNKGSILFPKMPTEELACVRLLEHTLQNINRQHSMYHSWMYTVLNRYGRVIGFNQVNPIMRAIFNGNLKHRGRFYSFGVNGYQNLSKKERRTMLIDGEPIAERDFSGLNTRMLYHKEGLDFQGDVYVPREVLPQLYKGHHPREVRDAARQYIKKVTNIILNASSCRSAIGAASVELQGNGLYKAALDACKTTPKKVILRIKRIHEPIAQYYHTGIGLSLQCEESFLILWTIQRFHASRRPALSLHDAILCKASDADDAQRIMAWIYEMIYGFTPEIKQSWPVE